MCTLPHYAVVLLPRAAVIVRLAKHVESRLAIVFACQLRLVAPTPQYQVAAASALRAQPVKKGFRDANVSLPHYAGALLPRAAEIALSVKHVECKMIPVYVWPHRFHALIPQHRVAVAIVQLDQP